MNMQSVFLADRQKWPKRPILGAKKSPKSQKLAFFGGGEGKTENFVSAILFIFKSLNYEFLRS